MEKKYKNLDDDAIKPITENKPFIQKITINVMIDDDPDLSYLEQDYKDTEDLNEREKYKEQDKERLDAYYRGSWNTVGVKASCEVLIPIGNKSFMTQKINSGGLWGIESDSDKEHIEEIKQEQIEELKRHLKLFNIDIPENVEIEDKTP